VTGLRLIGLDTTDRAAKVPGFFYDVGALSRGQLDFLRTELEAATARGEIVIVASHHPSAALSPSSGSEVSPEDFRALLNAYPAVVLHLCGHSHRNRVTERGGYIEVETCSTLDLPQEGRLVEIWRDGQDGRVAVVYEMFSDRDDALPALGADPLRALREQGYMIALGDKGAVIRQRHFDPEGRDPRGDARDREGVVVWRR
jgi:3',5'-cyclic AMP phosphodiesterase CpdA